MSGFNANNVPAGGGSNKPREVCEAGTYPARLVSVLVLGIQPQRAYKGEDKPPKLELNTTYELLDEFMKDENGEDDLTKPRWISESFPFNNLSADLATSTKRYLALDPLQEHGGDWSELVETPCMVTVAITEGSGKNAGKKYENISNVATMRPKEASKAPALVNPTRLFDFYNPDIEVFNTLPDWMKDKIKGALDYPGSALEALVEGKPAAKATGGAKKEPEASNLPPKAPVKGPEATDGEDW